MSRLQCYSIDIDVDAPPISKPSGLRSLLSTSTPIQPKSYSSGRFACLTKPFDHASSSNFRFIDDDVIIDSNNNGNTPKSRFSSLSNTLPLFNSSTLSRLDKTVPVSTEKPPPLPTSSLPKFNSSALTSIESKPAQFHRISSNTSTSSKLDSISRSSSLKSMESKLSPQKAPSYLAKNDTKVSSPFESIRDDYRNPIGLR
jgi:hypothetical protein